MDHKHHDRFEIRLAENGKGCGIFAVKDLKPGDLIFENHGAYVELAELQFLRIGRSWEIYHEQKPHHFREDMDKIFAVMERLRTYCPAKDQYTGSEIFSVPQSSVRRPSQDPQGQPDCSSAALPQFDLAVDPDHVRHFQEGCHIFHDFGYRTVLGYSETSSFLNHACSPNSQLSHACRQWPRNYDEGFIDLMQLRAILPITAGDELTIAYAPPVKGSSVAYRAWLEQYHGFQCVCKRCLHKSPNDDASYLSASKNWDYIIYHGGKSGNSLYRTGYELLQNFKVMQIEGIEVYTTYMTLNVIATSFGDAIRSDYFITLILDWCKKALGREHLLTASWFRSLMKIQAARTIPSQTGPHTESVIRELKRQDQRDTHLQSLIYVLNHTDDHYYNLYVHKGVICEETTVQLENRVTGADLRSMRRQKRAELYSATEFFVSAASDLFASAEADVAFADLCHEIEQSKDPSANVSQISVQKKKKKPQKQKKKQKTKKTVATYSSPQSEVVTSNSVVKLTIKDRCSHDRQTQSSPSRLEDDMAITDDWTVVERGKAPSSTNDPTVLSESAQPQQSNPKPLLLHQERLLHKSTGTDAVQISSPLDVDQDCTNAVTIPVAHLLDEDKRQTASTASMQETILSDQSSVDTNPYPDDFTAPSGREQSVAMTPQTSSETKNYLDFAKHHVFDENKDIECARSLVSLSGSTPARLNPSLERQSSPMVRKQVATIRYDSTGSSTAQTAPCTSVTVQSTATQKTFPSTVPWFMGFSRQLAQVMWPIYDSDPMAACLGMCGKRYVTTAVVIKPWTVVDCHNWEFGTEQETRPKVSRLFRMYRGSDNTGYAT